VICRFLPEAEAEHLEQVHWYEQHLSGLGARYLAAVQQALDRICEAPRRFPVVGTGELRRLSLERFPFTVYYAERAGDILIVAIAAHRRKPGYWSTRV
jgi:plasmid stabilization system protein ParE